MSRNGVAVIAWLWRQGSENEEAYRSFGMDPLHPSEDGLFPPLTAAWVQRLRVCGGHNSSHSSCNYHLFFSNPLALLNDPRPNFSNNAFLMSSISNPMYTCSKNEFLLQVQARKRVFPHWLLDMRPCLPLLDCVLFTTEGLFKQDTHSGEQEIFTFSCLLKCIGIILPLCPATNEWQEIWWDFLRPVTWVRWQACLSNSQYNCDFFYLLPVPNAYKNRSDPWGFCTLSSLQPSCPHSRNLSWSWHTRSFSDIVMQSFKLTVTWPWVHEIKEIF